MTRFHETVLFIWIIYFLSGQSEAIPAKQVINDVEQESALDFVLLHNNDLHGHFEETCITIDGSTRCFGGFARISTVVNQYRNDHLNGNGPQVLFLNAGDTYTGTPWFALFRDKIASEMMNALKPDAATLGNHEFDHGVKGLVPFLEQINFPMVVANLNISDSHPLMQTHSIKRSVTFNFNGTQIGVIGYLLPGTKEISTTDDVEFFPEIETINKEAEELKKEGVNIVIALGHSGYDKDQEIARDCPLVDIVVGAHSHSFLYTGTPPDTDSVEGPYPTIVVQKSGKKVPVVQASAFSKYMGILKLSFDKDGNLLRWNGAPILLDEKIDRDPEILKLLDKYRAEVEPLMKDVVGIAKVDLLKSSTEESNLGNLIADSFVFNRVQQYSGPGWTDASIALVNSGGIRDKAYIGDLTSYQLFTILPFDNTLMSVTIPGYILRKAFENAAASYVPGGYVRNFLQTSGVRVVLNVLKEPGHRVQSLEALCANCSVPVYEPVDDHKLYGVVIESYLYHGGDGMTMFEPFKAIEMNMTAFNATYTYAKHIHLLYPAIEGRTTIIDHNSKSNAVSMISNPSSVALVAILLIISQFFAKN